MGISRGVLGITGTLGGVTITKGGIARQAVGSRKVTSVRTSENNSEFGRAGKASKLFRDTHNSLTFVGYAGSDLTKQFMKAIKADTTSVRGQRNVIDGEAELIAGFETNMGTSFTSVLPVTIATSINRTTGDVTADIPSIVPAETFSIPVGATHAKVTFQASAIDFEAETAYTDVASTAYIPLNNSVLDPASITLELPANSTHPIFLSASVDFYQEINGDKYLLDNKQYAVGKVLAVDSGV